MEDNNHTNKWRTYKIIGVLLSVALAVLIALIAMKQLRSSYLQKQDEAARAAAINLKPEDGIILTNDEALVYKNVSPSYVLTYAENQTEDYPTTQGGYRFAQLVNLRTNGDVRVIVEAESSLGEEVSTVEQLRIGGIDIARVSLSSLSGYSSKSTVLTMPYLYRDADHMWSVLEGDVGAEVMDSFQHTGIVPLSWYDAGVRNFYSRSRINTLSDMKDMSIRVQSSAMMEDMVICLGAIPVPMAYGNVYSALQTGLVDAAENNWASYEAMKHDEVAQYFLNDEHVRIPEMQIISEVTMSKIPEEYQQIIRECAEESALYERALWTEREKQARERALEAGCIELSLSDQEKQKFREATKPVYEKYCGDYMDLLEKIEQQ